MEGDLLRAKARINALEARQKNQEIQTAAYRQELTSFDRLGKQMRELRRQVEINEENYKLYLNKFEQAKISQSMDSQKIASVSVIEPAIPPVKPIKPEKNRVVVIWVCLALLTGFGVPAFIEFINPVFRTREDIDQFLGLPVLATLPREK
ncbi:MAG: hypothetical protein GTO24_14170 [candidate division Zixibacteria bacterium]|nr:hypothetical protein [candidate division Zixibacteria bacterium]